MFTSDWFPRKVFEDHLAHLKQKTSLRTLEIGSFEGRGTTYFLENYTSGDGSVVCIDPFIPYVSATLAKIPDGTHPVNEETLARFLENTKPWISELTLIRGLSQNVMPLLVDGIFDLVFVDGDHSRDAVAFDGRESFRLLRPGGHIVFDDYLWGPQYSPESRPKDAIDQFLKDYADRLSVIHKVDQVVVRKNKASYSQIV